MLLAVAFTLATLVAEPVCTIGSGTGSWSGSPADLAQIEARFQQEAAEHAGRPFTVDAPASPWSPRVRCSEPPRLPV